MADNKGMGRGLAAILAAAPREAGEELRLIPVELVSANPRQPRRQFDEASLVALGRFDQGAWRHPARAGAAPGRRPLRAGRR